MIRWRLLLVLCVLLTCNTALAAVKGRVRASVDSENDIWVGQQVNLNLEVLTTGYRFSDIHFNLPEVSGAYLLQTDSTTIKLSETRNRETWQVIRYPLALFPQKSGTLQIPPIKVRFSTAESFGSMPRDYDLQTQTITINVQRPPGVNPGELVVSTGDFKLDYTWSPTPDSDKTLSASVGDAITLTVNRKAQNISGMLLNPLPLFETGGLRAYPGEPDVEDKVDRGDLTGERTDSITWIVEQRGDYQWPAIRIEWWDPESRKLRQKEVPGIAVQAGAGSVAANQDARSENTSEHSGWKTGAATALALVLIGLGIWWQRPRITRRILDHLARRSHTEKAAFRDLAAACGQGDAAAAYRALSRWQHSLAPKHTTLEDFARTTGVQPFYAAVLEIQETLVTQEPGTWDGKILLKSSHLARKPALRRKRRRRPGHLPALNP